MSSISPLFEVGAWAYGDYSTSGSGSGSNSGIAETQQRRAAERFNIIDWIQSNNAAIASQNARYRSTSSKPGPHTDINILYMQSSGPVTRNTATLGKDTRALGRLQFFLDDLFTRGSKTQSLNIDLGLEGYTSQTTNFTVDPSSTQASHSYTETGGALLVRPFGRSSQDTGLILKGGCTNFSEIGLWANTQGPVSMYSTYLGAEAKLYLLPFLGGRGEYQNVLENTVDQLQSKWKLQRFIYGAFVELYLIELGAYFENTEMVLTPNSSGAPVKEVYQGVSFSGTLHF